MSIKALKVLEQIILRPLIISLLVCLAIPSIIYGQSLENQLDSTRDWFRKVNKNIADYEKVEYPYVKISRSAPIESYSIESNQIYCLTQTKMTKFFDDKQLTKIVLEFSGNHEDLISEYYFKDDELIFVDKNKVIYHSAKQDSVFRETAKSVARNRFYIEEDRLIKWVDTDIQSVSKQNPFFKAQEAMIVHDYKLYKRIN